MSICSDHCCCCCCGRKGGSSIEFQTEQSRKSSRGSSACNYGTLVLTPHTNCIFKVSLSYELQLPRFLSSSPIAELHKFCTGMNESSYVMKCFPTLPFHWVKLKSSFVYRVSDFYSLKHYYILKF